MKLRPPAVPLITVDPYFSVWSMADKLTDDTTKHWTGEPNTILGTVSVDGEEFGFMGKTGKENMRQVFLDVEAMNTRYVFENETIRLYATFFTPLLMNDLDILSRPVSYLYLQYEPLDGEEHEVSATVSVSEEICLDKKGQSPVKTVIIELGNEIVGVKIGNSVQNVLNRSGDNVRIDWGYFYLSSNADDAKASVFESDGMVFASVTGEICDCCGALFTFAYDDIYAVEYFKTHLKSYWNRNGFTIENAIMEAFDDYPQLYSEAKVLSDELYINAVKAGGEKYAELLLLAYRQSVAAHKVAVDENGEVLFISKECFSNGCAATVDVSYPSTPLYLYYNTEFVKGMMRPILRFANSDMWKFDFAPHDCGQYPLVNCQVYGGIETEEHQMPVEECGNMLVMLSNVCIVDGNADFAEKDMETYKKWASYLLKYGEDPGNQLCTDDFAGHLAHNCNLALKAIMGLAGLSAVLSMLGEDDESDYYYEQAINMAIRWRETAADINGGFRLAFDKEGTFSMKYNMIWDKIWGTNLFSRQTMDAELYSNEKHINLYGMPLDNRADYTKSDWLVWTAALNSDKDKFIKFTDPLWHAYNSTKNRVPMTDWYDTVTSNCVGFRNRTVIGGLFIRLLDYSGKARLN